MEEEGLVAEMMEHLGKDRWHIRCQSFWKRVSRELSKSESPRFGAHVECIRVAVVICDDVLVTICKTADNAEIVGIVNPPVDLYAVTSYKSGRR